MTEERLDCRGLACPNPVLKTKEVIDRGNTDRLTVLVDNSAAQENVSRFLVRFGYQVAVNPHGDYIEIVGNRSAPSGCEIAPEPGELSGERKIMILLGTERLGRGDDDLGKKLVTNFLGTLKEMGPDLWRLVLLNGGVKLAADGSEVLPALQGLEGEGIHILVCGTCLNHFGLLEKKRVGETTNMLDIVTAMQLADKVITLT